MRSIEAAKARLTRKPRLVFTATATLIAGLLFNLSLASAQPACSQRWMDRLESESGQIKRWSKLQSFFHRYERCRTDDAEVETGAGVFVVRLLAHWSSLPAASRLVNTDPRFKAFVLAGLNITDATEDLHRIDTLAAQSCPAHQHRLCTSIRNAIQHNY